MPGGGDPIEPLVGDTLKLLLGASSWTQYDVDGVHDLAHDLDLLFDQDPREVAVEVTRLTESDRRRQQKSIGRYTAATSALRRRWTLAVRRNDLPLKTAHRDLDPSLQVFEALGAEEFPRSSDYERPGYLAALQSLRSHGVTEGRSEPVDDGADGEVHIVETVVVHHDAAGFSAAIQQLVSDNAHKLLEARRSVTLLAVWVDTWSWQGPAPMSHEGMLPVEPLALPERCEGVVVLREAFPFQPLPDRAWTYGAAEGLLPSGWSDVTRGLVGGGADQPGDGGIVGASDVAEVLAERARRRAGAAIIREVLGDS